ncbi:MAG TPA: hypothetical protein VJ991_08195 [Balneolales bacterium]|jgi:hypothetical protein|nr:hypothetical protein [Balneolales bacterium]
MNAPQKYIVFGPVDTLKRLGPALLDDVNPKYQYQFSNYENEIDILVAVFEEYQRQLNSSTALTVIFELSGKNLKIEMLPTGGRMGFRGSSLSSDQPLPDMVTDFIMDFAKRFGLTVQELRNNKAPEKES